MSHDEAIEPGRGIRLVQAVERLPRRLERLPRSAPLWSPRIGEHEIRRAKVRRHPYLVVYAIRRDYLLIIAVAHTRMKPDYWVTRASEAGPLPR